MENLKKQMKKYILVLLIGLAMQTISFSQSNSPHQIIQVFPYQHRIDAIEALKAMQLWNKPEWKQFFALTEMEDTKTKAIYALHAYVNAIALTEQKTAFAMLLKKQIKKRHTPFIKITLQEELKLLTTAQNTNARNALLPALPNSPAAQSPSNPNYANAVQQILKLEDEMHLASSPIAQKSILIKAARLPGFSSFVFVRNYLDNPILQKEAALIIARLALADASIRGPFVRTQLEKALPLLSGVDSSILSNKLVAHLNAMPYDYGFENIFNGKDLTGWKGLVGNPIYRSKQSDSNLQILQQKADEKIKTDWVVKDGLLVFTGHGDNLCTIKQYGNFEMYVDWKITEKGDAGIYLRGSPQVQIWDTSRREVGAQVGSGGLYNNQKNSSKPLVVADNAIGQWNQFHIIMKGDKVSVYLNGVLVTDQVTLENYWDRSLPIFVKEQIELQAHGTYVAYRNIFIRELPPETATALSIEEQKEGFHSLFDGSNLDQWMGNKAAYQIKDGVIEVVPNKGSGGNLYTKEEYANFIYRFEFQLTPGANNGIGIHAPPTGDAAYYGMEIQVLDNEATKYAGLQPYQYHGSVYGIAPAKRGYLLPTGQWNQEEIVVQGNRIRVILNGTIINEVDIKEVSKNGTMDHKEHPGLLKTMGHIGFLGHGDILRFKNIRIKNL